MSFGINFYKDKCCCAACADPAHPQGPIYKTVRTSLAKASLGNLWRERDRTRGRERERRDVSCTYLCLLCLPRLLALLALLASVACLPCFLAVLAVLPFSQCVFAWLLAPRRNSVVLGWTDSMVDCSAIQAYVLSIKHLPLHVFGWLVGSFFGLACEICKD